MGTVENFYLNQVVMDLANGDFNLTDLVPNGISVSDPVFFNDGAVNVSSSNTVHCCSWQHVSVLTSPISSVVAMPGVCGLTGVERDELIHQLCALHRGQRPGRHCNWACRHCYQSYR